MKNMRKRFVGLIVIAILVSLIIVYYWTQRPLGYKNIYVDCSAVIGEIRSMQGVNAGPLPSLTIRGPPWGGSELNLSEEYIELGVNYVRIHDFCHAGDIDVMFPDLNADPMLQNSYNFTTTDEIIGGIKAIGADVIFRLGYSWTLESGARVTYINESDYNRWADVVKHIIMHYNDGWANGFHHDIKYWEIWNEPDDSHFWTGTPEQYYRLYGTTAKMIKAYNPNLKIGGPAAIWIHYKFIEDFLNYCRTYKIPLDFVSWHHYYPLHLPLWARLIRHPGADSLPIAASKIQGYLNEYGFNSTESLLTEWNLYTGEREESPLERAVYAASGLIYLQDTAITIANYYRGDAWSWWGLFNNTGGWKKQAYAFKAFKIMLETPNRINCTGLDAFGYAALAGKSNDNRRVTILISNFKTRYNGYHLTVDNLPWGNQAFKYERYLLDETHDLTLVESGDFSGSKTFIKSESLPSPSFQLIILTSE